MSKEILGKQIASIHNLGFYLNLMQIARKKINEGTFYKWKEKMVKKLDERI
jgi:queuine tRNA-ribosyltransferase